MYEENRSLKPICTLYNVYFCQIRVINKACGLDIHKQFLIATILSIFGEKKQLRFERNEKGILDLKKWGLTEKCDVVACESTSDFWVPIYDSLINHLNVINHLDVIVGNARDMKAFTHKKRTKTIKTKGVSVFWEKFLAFKSWDIFLKFLVPSAEGERFLFFTFLSIFFM